MAIGRYDVNEASLTNDNGKVIINGNWMGLNAIAGLKMPFHCVFTKYMIHQKLQSGETLPLRSGKINLKRCWLNLFNSGGFIVTVEDESSQVKSKYAFTTRNTGTLNNQLSQMPLDDSGKKWEFGVLGNSENMRISVDSDEPTPLCITGTGFIGDYINDARDI